MTGVTDASFVVNEDPGPNFPWNRVGADTLGVRVNLEPGAYVFAVRAIDEAGGTESKFFFGQNAVLMQSSRGPFVLALVGATIVGSMATVWHGVVNPPRAAGLREWRYADGQVLLKQGEEMGRFLLGSTVVMLFPKGPLQFNTTWAPGGAIRLGERMADWTDSASA